MSPSRALQRRVCQATTTQHEVTMPAPPDDSEYGSCNSWAFTHPTTSASSSGRSLCLYVIAPPFVPRRTKLYPVHARAEFRLQVAELGLTLAFELRLPA